MNEPLASLLAKDALWSGIAALGFAVLFNVPRRWLAACVLLGAAGHALRALLLRWGLVGVEAATLGAATLVGFAAHFVSRFGRIPSMTCALPAAIPMVPGAYAFKTMLALLRLVGGAGATSPALAVDALVAGAKTALILAALVVGVGSPYLVFHRSDTADLEVR